ncbi:hypothetical protein BJ912DRAFT_1105871 [Pholiota molesta]|nr:hypothetical protein BJ912DRAFT_1105871 [Pholiota molesta]
MACMARSTPTSSISPHTSTILAFHHAEHPALRGRDRVRADPLYTLTQASEMLTCKACKADFTEAAAKAREEVRSLPPQWSGFVEGDPASLWIGLMFFFLFFAFAVLYHLSIDIFARLI